MRWTEQRNFEAVLDMMAAGKIDVKPLISHRFRFEEAEKAYELISENTEPYLGIILQYDPQITQITQINERTIRLRTPSSVLRHPSSAVVGVIGAGNFTGQVLLPAISKNRARLKTIASGGGVTGTHLGKKFGFEESTTDADSIFEDPEVNTVFITTRHNSHAFFVLKALKAGKNVFVEKPLCLTLEELNAIVEEVKKFRGSEDQKDSIGSTSLLLNFSPSPLLMVGFNRRFAPHVVKMKELLSASKEPKSFVMTVNAGSIPADHWTQDPQVGGGRIIGEAYHFVDLIRYLAGNKIENAELDRMAATAGDTVSISLRFADGSIGTVHYFANGSRQFPKELLEVFCGGRVLQLDNFRRLKGYGYKNFKKMSSWGQDKGHAAEVAAFLDAVENGGEAPIPFDEIVKVTGTTIRLPSGRLPQ